MQPNLRPFERAVRLFLGAFMLFAAAVLFKHWAARVLTALFGVYALWECAAAKCPLASRLGVQSRSDRMKPDSLYLLGLSGVQIVLAYEWWSAGWEKVSSPEFVAGISKTLGYFASKNPFPWYKSFLEGFATENATVFAYAVEWSQAAIAAVLAVSAVIFVSAKRDAAKQKALLLSVLALVGGMLMNANFYLAAGWTGPGTKGSNVVMFWAEGVLLYVWLTSLREARAGQISQKKPL